MTERTEWLAAVRPHCLVHPDGLLMAVSNPKVACTSLKWWFAQQAGVSDETVYQQLTREAVPELAVHDVLPRLRPDVANVTLEALDTLIANKQVRKIAFLRNPYTRLFSAWQSKILIRDPLSTAWRTFSESEEGRQAGTSTTMGISIESIRHDLTLFVEFLMRDQQSLNEDAHFRPQWLHLRPDLIGYDFLGRIELGAATLAEHLGNCGAPPSVLAGPPRNVSILPFDPDFMSDEAIQGVREIYRDDFRNFAYETDPPLGARFIPNPSLDSAVTQLTGRNAVALSNWDALLEQLPRPMLPAGHTVTMGDLTGVLEGIAESFRAIEQGRQESFASIAAVRQEAESQRVAASEARRHLEQLTAAASDLKLRAERLEVSRDTYRRRLEAMLEQLRGSPLAEASGASRPWEPHLESAELNQGTKPAYEGLRLWPATRPATMYRTLAHHLLKAAHPDLPRLTRAYLEHAYSDGFGAASRDAYRFVRRTLKLRVGNRRFAKRHPSSVCGGLPVASSPGSSGHLPLDFARASAYWPVQTNRMRKDYPVVWMLVNDFDSGGLERVVLDLSRQFLKIGYLPQIVVSGSSGRAAHEARACGIQVFSQQRGHDLRLLAGESSPQIVLLHHDYNHLEELSRLGLPVVEILHNSYSWQSDNLQLREWRRSRMAMAVAVSDLVKDFSISSLGVPSGLVRVIPNGIDPAGLVRPPLHLLAESRLLTQRAPRFVMVANGFPQKNHALVIDAWKLILETLPEASLCLVGDLDVHPATSSNVRKRLAALPKSARVHLTGPLARPELSRLLASGHVGLLPSEFEGHSIATLEYAFFGLPSVLSPTGSAIAFAEQYAHARILAPRSESSDADSEVPLLKGGKVSPSGIAEACCEVASNYEKYLRAATSAAQDWQAYSIAEAASQYSRLIDDILN